MASQRGKADIIAVAKAARVSISTVSRAFNHPELLRPQTRVRVERAVQRLGYIRNRAAQTIHGRRSATIGLVVPTIDHAIFAEVIQAFSESVEEAGFTILTGSHHYDLRREYLLLRKLLEHRVDGVALIGLEHDDASHRLIEEQGIPAIAVWNWDAASRLSCVGARNRDAGRIAAEHLLALGHREIGLVFPGTRGNDRAADRLAGAEAALASAGLSVPDAWRLEVPYSLSHAKAACRDFLATGPRPTALLCGNDIIAHGAVYAAQSLSLAVPDRLSVMGIGDFKGSAEIEPGLSTVRIPARDIGRQAGHLMAHAIIEADDTIVRHRCELTCIPRGTTASAARA